MLYFKHLELVNQYHVSLKTVHNWIDSAKQGKVNLKLYTSGSRTYIANTSENALVLQQLAENGKKYRNSLHHKVIEPKPEFYDIYSRRQILDVITNLQVHGEIPLQYSYLQDGAKNWDELVQHWSNEDAASSLNNLNNTIKLLEINAPAIERLIEGKKRVNIIDLGVGNGYPVRGLLGRLMEMNVLHRYIGIDISPTMLSIAESNIKQWYGDKVRFEGHVRDFTYEQFDDLLVDDMLDNSADNTLNLVLLLGDTAGNFRSFDDTFKTVYRSMGTNDMLVYGFKPDTLMSRRYFNFDAQANSDKNKLALIDQYILRLLNIDESLYDAEMGFDPVQRMRYIRIRLKISVTLEFRFANAEREVNLDKGDTILLYRSWHLTAPELIERFEKIGLTLLQSSLTNDRRYFLSISGVNPQPE
jgi:uncharacterized SAM-dependent methyltransferase